jgi:hypothetical protein
VEGALTVDSNQSGSTVPRRQLGRYLRELRENVKPRKITIEQAAKYLECSTQKIWRIETGASPVRSLEVKALCELYEAGADYTQALVSLAAETKAKGWWESYGDTVPDWFELYVGLEGAASRLRKFEPTIIPGLLQAPAYMEVVLRANRPDLADAAVDRLIKVRRERQGLLARHFPAPPRLEVIIAEAALQADPGVPGAMHQQAWHLLKANEQPHLSVRVLPTSAGPHRASASGAFTILEFPVTSGGKGEPPTVYSESLTGAIYLDRPKELAVYEAVWEALAALALDEDNSDDMIRSVMATGEMSEA